MRLKGQALEDVRREDIYAEVERLEPTLETLRHEHRWAVRNNDPVLVDSLAESIDALIVLISGLEDGSIAPPRQPYVEADRWAGSDYGPVIDWQRWTEREIAESKRRRRVGL